MDKECPPQAKCCLKALGCPDVRGSSGKLYPTLPLCLAEFCQTHVDQSWTLPLLLNSMFKLTLALPHTFVRRLPLMAGDDFTYSQETTTTFQELLTLIDSNTRELPSVLFPAHHAALTQLPLTYPWARLVLDLKELLLSFDRRLLTCLIANNVQGNATPHPGLSSQAFSSILRSSSCLSFPPMMPMTHRPFFTTRKITTLNSGTRTWITLVPDFPPLMVRTRLLGNQICHWTMGTSETCMKVTHLVVFLPPALGAYVLSQHRSKSVFLP